MDIKAFELQVVEQSKTTPVLVDFWAPWCGPCQVIGPVLEELVTEAQGKWKLVKVNVDESQELAAKFGVRGIPNIKLFIDGKVTSEQTGALPKYQMEKWLEEQIPDPRTAELNSILRRLQQGESNALIELSSFVGQHPDFDEAKVVLAEHVVLSDPEKARQLTEDIAHKEIFLDRLTNINDLAELISTQFDTNGGVSEKLANAQSLLKKGEMEKALEEIIDSVRVNKSFNNDLPRRSAIAIFNVLGPSHEITRSQRRKFDMALY
ncbi:MAG: thioredoxin [Bacteroidota bacterium]